MYLCAVECRNASATPLFFFTDQEKYGAPNAYKFSSGLRQEFPKGVCRLDLSQYKIPELTHAKEDVSYYPIVISIEAIFPPTYKGRAKKSVHFTYGVFALETDGSLRFKFI